ncbi:hypothetical protein BaRGS_00034191, partial [Batillaria attramentaria]
ASAAGGKPVDGDDTEPWVSVDGVVFPRFFQTNRPMREHIECLKALEMRDDDVIVAAFPKCGTHWMWEIACMLMTGRAEYDTRTKDLAMLEATESRGRNKPPPPGDLQFSYRIRSKIKEKKVKILHVYRNPKDVVVSLYFHSRQNPTMTHITIDTMLDKYFFSQDPVNKNCTFFKYHKDVDAFFKANPDIPVFSTSFENMKEDLAGEVRRVAEFLGVSHTPEFCRQVADACGFDRLKEADKTKNQLLTAPPVQMFRKGEVGDWKNHLTEAQSKRIDDAMKQLEGCDYHFRYTL